MLICCAWPYPLVGAANSPPWCQNMGGGGCSHENIWARQLSICFGDDITNHLLLGLFLAFCYGCYILLWSFTANSIIECWVLIAAIMKNSVFLNITPCSLAVVHQCFRRNASPPSWGSRTKESQQGLRLWLSSCWLFAWLLLRPWW